MRTEIRLPCSLFVPRVKESRLCSVCGYTILDHHLETPLYANNRYHYKDHHNDEVFHSNGHQRFFSNGGDSMRFSRPHTVSPPRILENQFTPSKNSAFTEYKRTNSKDSIPISSVSASPVSFKASPYSHLEDRRLIHKVSMNSGDGHQIHKPKPLPMQRNYLKTQNGGSPVIEEYGSKNHTPSSQMFKKIKQKKPKERASSIGDNIGQLSNENDTKNNIASKPSETIIRPHNFREILNRFQSAADVTEGFQRHHSVRLPVTRRLTLDSDLPNSTSVDLRRAGPTATTIPIPSPRHSKVDQIFYHDDSDLSEVDDNTTGTDKSSPFPVSTALQESNAKYENETANIDLNTEKSESSRASSHNNTSPSYNVAHRYGQAGVVLSPTHHSNDELSSPEEEVTISRPMNLKKQFDGLRKSRPVYRSHSTATRRSSSSTPFNALVPIRVIKEHDVKKRESFNEKVAETSQTLNARTVMAVDYISGSDSGYPRWSGAGSAESSSLESPRSPLLRSPNPQRTKAADDVYNQMTLGHTNSLALLADNFSEISKLYVDHTDLGKETFRNISLSSIVFKSPSPVFMKEKVALFEANFLANNYEGFPVTIMMAPTCHYAPLMGRHAERSGFGPPVLTEFEDSEDNIRHLVDTCFEQRNNIRVVVMPPMSVCSFHSLAAHNMHQGMDVNHYEQHVVFIMLQLLSALKYLQSDGVEHMSNNFKEFLLTYKETILKIALQELHSLPKLMLLKETMEEDFDEHASVHNFHEGGRVGMCKYALRALCTLLNHKMHNTVPDIQERTEFSWPLKQCAELLHRDKSSSLTEAKNLLEFAFFVGGQTRFENEYDAKLWLDEKRAQQVNRMVRLLVEKSEDLSDNRERMYVQFLLSSTPRTLFNTFKCLHKR